MMQDFDALGILWTRHGDAVGCFCRYVQAASMACTRPVLGRVVAANSGRSNEVLRLLPSFMLQQMLQQFLWK